MYNIFPFSQLRTYAWCWSIPPKCSRYKIQMKTVYKTEVLYQCVDILISRYLHCRYVMFNVVIVPTPDDPQDPDGERMLQRLHSQRQRFLLCPDVSVSGYNI